MLNVLPRSDVTLYGLVHGILTAERARDDAERRAGRRHSYRCTQLIAPLQDNVPPGQLQFRPVQCVDLSAAGLSYLSDEPAPGIAVVVALGNEPLICLSAEVIRQERIVHESRFLHRVACRFTGRAIEP
jgi:hypothetical protein